MGPRQITSSSSTVVPAGLGYQGGGFMTTPLPSPSPRRRALFKEETVLESEHFQFGMNGRKRQASGSTCSSSGLPFDFSTLGSDAPLAKRMRL